MFHSKLLKFLINLQYSSIIIIDNHAKLARFNLLRWSLNFLYSHLIEELGQAKLEGSKKRRYITYYTI